MTNLIKDLVTLCNTNEHLAQRANFVSIDNSTMSILGNDVKGIVSINDRIETSKILDFKIVLEDTMVTDHIVDSDDFVYDLMKVIRKEI
jgi:hypothetical protein